MRPSASYSVKGLMELIRIPKFSENMDEATIVEWLKREGDAVSAGDVLLSVITDKADVEIEATGGGTLLKVIAPEKSSVPVNFVVGLVGEPGESLPDYEGMNREIRDAFSAATVASERVPTEKPAEAPAPNAAAPAPVSAAAIAPAPAAGIRVQATPAAKRLAKQHNIDLAAVKDFAQANGPVTQEMVEAFLKQRVS